MGSESFSVAMYIANRPGFGQYPELAKLKPLESGEIAYIVANTSNHWRKVFNVYAKFLSVLRSRKNHSIQDWRSYRDDRLLQSHSTEALLFSPPEFGRSGVVHIVAGKTYAADMGLESVEWLDSWFAVDVKKALIVCPYLDYRQLSDNRIERLADLVLKFG
ncbi:hypothetical Protein YC6258_03908 [Gynuella sunshinyii YC6258]|uniref:Uncharacterized protein n=1 Tax=Gynuella sunshinyii YC6258 TaxID=1445510 RepID=A0A0C5VZT9_9GAMM|nr:hypothetical Protein YC6258_03908 [Gynuella sunshinyii YC6258]